MGFGEGAAVDFVDVHHTFDDGFVVRGENLDAACPIDFHSIVAGRIVAGGDHDAAKRSWCGGRRKESSGVLRKAVEEEDFETGGGHDFGAELGEVARVVAGVVGDGAAQVIGHWSFVLGAACTLTPALSQRERETGKRSRRRLGRFRRWCDR